jgi:hypothetical protein
VEENQKNNEKSQPNMEEQFWVCERISFPCPLRNRQKEMSFI